MVRYVLSFVKHSLHFVKQVVYAIRLGQSFFGAAMFGM